ILARQKWWAEQAQAGRPDASNAILRIALEKKRRPGEALSRPDRRVDDRPKIHTSRYQPLGCRHKDLFPCPLKDHEVYSWVGFGHLWPFAVRPRRATERERVTLNLVDSRPCVFFSIHVPLQIKVLRALGRVEFERHLESVRGSRRRPVVVLDRQF